MPTVMLIARPEADIRAEFRALMADGSVHFIGESILPTVWQAMATIAGGETPQPLD